ncbi:MAG: polysaccharide biosynthesis/export family protein [Pyrinomonadaceae bacterium]|nr:polysaccharide biosynthesis/export family protein [Pyrinomonadaceae bacterium]
MKAVKIAQFFVFGILLAIFLSANVSAQEVVLKQRDRITQAKTTEGKSDELPLEKKSDDAVIATPPAVNDDDDDIAAVSTYYRNYLTEYRLGPEDVISVQVFGQCPDYCKESITVPPTAMISYPLIREGIFVGGKTIDQVTSEITKKLDEYIIDPKVTVSLVKVGSARYGVVGKVEKQGNYLMNRKMSVLDAIAESGGIAKDGDKKHAVILRPNPVSNKLDPILVNLKEIQEGRAEMAFLEPGDQVLVPKEGFSLSTLLDNISKFSLLRILMPF